MASFPKVATDFDQIIQADRQRKKNEQLAKEIFGRSKQKANNNKKDDKRPSRPQAPSLASRVGINKRSSSTSSNNPSPKLQAKPRTSLPHQNARASRIANEISNGASANIIPSQLSIQPTLAITNAIANTSGGISIKGASGPFVLHASNFAPGTTAADIESALHPDTIYGNGISSLVSCKLVNTKPDVVAELVFTEKVVAESIISKYNGQKADGRILRVELVRSGVGSMSKAHTQAQTQTPTPPPQQSHRRERQPKQPQQQPLLQQTIPPQNSDLDFEPEIALADENAMEDIEMDADASATDTPSNFIEDREAADRDRRDRDTRRDRGDQQQQQSFESSKRRGGGDNNNNNNSSRRRNERERSRDRDRGGDRGERDRDRDRPRGDREYERRDDRRGGMSSHYGNGVGGHNNNNNNSNNMQRGGGFNGPQPSTGGGGGAGYGGGPGGGVGGGYRGGRFNDGYGGGGGRGGGGFRGGFRGYR